MTNAQLIPAILAPLIVWRIYRRLRTNIGRQPYRLRRIVIVLTAFSLVLAMILVGSLAHSELVLGLGGGLATGVVLGFLGLKFTQFDFSPSGGSYTPNPYLGIGVSLLLISRIVYRFTVLYSIGGSPGAADQARLGQSPLTLLLFGLTTGYYLSYYSGLLLRFRAAGAEQGGQ